MNEERALDMKTIGARIRERRNELGLRQTVIREKTGISSGNLSEIENGNRTPSMATLYRLSEILDCSIDWMVKGEDSSEKKIPAFSLSEEESQLLRYYHGMSTGDREDFRMIGEMKYNKERKKGGEMSSNLLEDERASETG